MEGQEGENFLAYLISCSFYLSAQSTPPSPPSTDMKMMAWYLDETNTQNVALEASIVLETPL